jgi:hypothetical protein
MMDMFLACGAADGNGRLAYWFYHNFLIGDFCTTASINQQLREAAVLHVNNYNCE